MVRLERDNKLSPQGVLTSAHTAKAAAIRAKNIRSLIFLCIPSNRMCAGDTFNRSIYADFTSVSGSNVEIVAYNRIYKASLRSTLLMRERGPLTPVP